MRQGHGTPPGGRATAARRGRTAAGVASIMAPSVPVRIPEAADTLPEVIPAFTHRVPTVSTPRPECAQDARDTRKCGVNRLFMPGRFFASRIYWERLCSVPHNRDGPCGAKQPGCTDSRFFIMGAKLKVAGWVALGAMAGVMTTMQLQANARSTTSPLPLEELQQLAAVFGLVKSDYVEPVDEKKLINDAIAGMVGGPRPPLPVLRQEDLQGIPREHVRQASSASASRSAWKTAWSRSSRRSKARPPSAPASRAAT